MGGEGSDVRMLRAAAAQMGKKRAAHACITGGGITDVKKAVAAWGKKAVTTRVRRVAAAAQMGKTSNYTCPGKKKENEVFLLNH
uniref:Uncharacterized protein n=1 Tax=Oryza nivara TaxID=4536 RepID=A0A0E0GYL1_ORYNI